MIKRVNHVLISNIKADQELADVEEELVLLIKNQSSATVDTKCRDGYCIFLIGPVFPKPTIFPSVEI